MSHKSYWLDVIIACVVLNCILCIVLITCDTIINKYLLTYLLTLLRRRIHTDMTKVYIDFGQRK